MTFKDKEGFDINVLAFDGESNFAILDRTSTGSPTPYVVVKGLDTESATWSNSEGYFANYEDCVRKYKSSVLEHTQSDIPMKAMFEYLLRRDIEPMLSRTLTDDEVWQAYDSSRIERLIATGKYFTDEEMEHYNSMNKDEILPTWLLEKCGLSDYTNNSQAVARPDWMEEHEILIDRDDDYVLLRDPDENVNQVWTASGEFLSTVQLENETVDEAMEEYYYNISKGDIEL